MEMRKIINIINEATDDIDSEFNRELERVQQKGEKSSKTIQQLQQQLTTLLDAYREVQQITTRIKNNDLLTGILSDVSRLAADNDINGESYSYQESTILEKSRELEEAVYGLDELFKDEIDAIKNKIEELEYDL